MRCNMPNNFVPYNNNNQMPTNQMPNNNCCNTDVCVAQPIVTCCKQVVDKYHITKQPYVNNYHTEIVHHHIVEPEFVPNYTCSEVHVKDNSCKTNMYNCR